MLERWRKKQSYPFRDIFSIQDDMNRLFEDFFLPGEGGGGGLLSFVPSVDLSETKDQIKVKVDLPGISEKDIEVTMENNVLTIKGKRESEKETKDESYYSRERVCGTFLRQITLPKKVNPESVKAKFKNGVLDIAMDKAQEERSKLIEIVAED